jgi:protein-S-isoprenylcysteine O-methyltransferase Ste14
MFDDIDVFMRVAFTLQVFGVSLVRSAFAGLQGGENKGRKWKESPIFLVVGIPFSIAFVYVLGTYLLSREAAWMTLDLPNGVRWIGLGASLAVSGFLVWVFKTIGMAGSKVLVTFEGMKLATTGPYARVRHPMYLGFALWGLTWIPVTANWALGALMFAFIVYVARFRVPREERVLIEHFGDEYRQYIERTGRFLPLRSGTDGS